MNKVTVTAGKDGHVITPSKNGKGHIRVQQTRVLSEDGWMRTITLSALVHGDLDALKKSGWVIGQEIPGCIHVKEQLTPFNKENPDKDLKIAGETGIVCSVAGQPIYRKCFHNSDPSAPDVIVEHDNTVEIKAANEKIKATSAIDAQ